MNKAGLVEAIAENASMTKKDAGAALDAAIKAVTDALANGEEVAIMGFGTFAVRERAARMGLNPATGEKMAIPASKVPSFRAGKTLKEAVK